MRDLAILVAMGWTLAGLRLWVRWYWPILILAAVALLERPDPEPPSQRVTAFDLTVAETRWGRATWPAVSHELVLP